MEVTKRVDSRKLTFDQWIEAISVSPDSEQKIRQWMKAPDFLLAEGQHMIEVLLELHMDDATLLAAFTLPSVIANAPPEEQLLKRYGAEIVELQKAAMRMDAIKALQGGSKSKLGEGQVDNIRRMLLAMVEDVRAVVLKLAERLCSLRHAKHIEEESRVLIARECASIYAPLANRLGIGQLKWELEDLSFRYLHPETYKSIASLLEQKRTERERYMVNFVAELGQLIKDESIRADVHGRPKHIFSIWKKMQKKRLTFDQLFDIRAVRIIAERLQDCYAALGTVHAHWKHIASEFDDYIATPKPNGYQSIHTVVLGPEERTIEVQIRTEQMHQDAELGVAAHWKYKEGGGTRSGSEDKINWLRKILQWQEDMSDADDVVEELRSQVFDDRVYVFTPKGDVIDLPVGSTPLDFAYYIHSNVGHTCTGAKVGGRIVPLTYQLRNGDQVDVLRGSKANPSRDWMNPSSGYINSSRARAKIQTWFKQQDKEKNHQAGRELLESELHRAHLDGKDIHEAVEKFNLHALDDLYTAIGAGDVRINQVIHFLQQKNAPKSEIDPRLKQKKAPSESSKDAVVIEGVGNLMSQMAKCCNPLPGDQIQGYITVGRGVSVHRQDCEQLEHLSQQHPERLIDVAWTSQLRGAFETRIRLIAVDRDGLMRDLTTVLANYKVTLLGVNSISNRNDNTAKVELNIEVRDLETLSKTIHHLRTVDSVMEVKRADH